MKKCQPVRPRLFEHLQRRCIYARRALTTYAATLGLAAKEPNFTKKPPDQLRWAIEFPGSAEYPEFAESLAALNSAFEVLDVVGSPDHHPRFELTAQDEYAIESALKTFDNLRQLKALISLRDRYTKGLNNPEGRTQGGATMAARAQEHTQYIKKAVLDILKHRSTFDRDDGQIADWLMERGFETHKGQTRTRKTMMRYVKAIRTEFKARN